MLLMSSIQLRFVTMSDLAHILPTNAAADSNVDSVSSKRLPGSPHFLKTAACTHTMKSVSYTSAAARPKTTYHRVVSLTCIVIGANPGIRCVHPQFLFGVQAAQPGAARSKRRDVNRVLAQTVQHEKVNV